MSKRNRIFRSSSLGEVGLFAATQLIEPPVARLEKKRPTLVTAAVRRRRPIVNSKPPVAKPEQPRRSILTLGSPVLLENNEGYEKRADERYGVFLEACYFCKKKIDEDGDVFMYGYLRAFCSLDCRNMQMAFDENNRQPSPKSTQIMAESFLKKGLDRRELDPRITKLAAAS
ncbi:uncharacterized protein LOC131151568 [Malania oleifera]|uniref:uncharacterized protein LOC131151568 n=1 Tax=Malania oleifera TaxID=397392 RepID=UPI0025ADE78D|nr:uncharacterized protein LOC131151568 [Malania oleifera]